MNGFRETHLNSHQNVGQCLSIRVVAVGCQVFDRHGPLDLVEQDLHFPRRADSNGIAQADLVAAHLHKFARKRGDDLRADVAFERAPEDARDVAGRVISGS